MSGLIRRGEVWRVCLDPTVGDEMQKTRPCVVISADGVGRLRLKTIVPITAPAKEQALWHVPISPHSSNGLGKPSVADALQIRSLSHNRFVTKLGRLTAQQMDDVAAAVAIVLEIR
ncbi:MAG: type II toxin-antitoxin system PemK/MazF family toxin [Terrimicrobiaceae bacterium]|nr:type II toxin-antitoxin system PemK/MazF family toxin [Terrimicrobiaceae bacterium]